MTLIRCNTHVTAMLTCGVIRIVAENRARVWRALAVKIKRW